MKIRFVVTLLALCQPLLCFPAQDKPEEIVITGERAVLELRTQMWEAEANAYSVFNQYNDEARFNISCRMQAATGSRIERQVCQPEFVREAATGHARDYAENLRVFMTTNQNDTAGINPPYTPSATHQPMAAVIARQQQDYRDKMKQVAEEHPEFLEALIHYSETRARYENATSTVDTVE